MNTLHRSDGPWRAAVLTLLVASLGVGACASAQTSGPWSQFGGPNRNFMVDNSTPLADEWPDAGPRQLWKRSLGDGYSTIAVDGPRLYTMFRNRGEDDKPTADEIVTCLDAKTGQTLWEYSYKAPALEHQNSSFGWGPNPTPTIADNRVFTAGFTGIMHCLDKNTGKVLWSHNLATEFKCKPGTFGYSVSPTVYKDTVIMLSGPDGNAVIAFNQNDGSVAWKKHDFKPVHCSPLMIHFNGQDQLICLMDETAVAVDPNDGTLLWQHPMKNASNISTPVWGDDGLLFCSSAYDSGSRAIKLTATGSQTTPEEIWYTRKIRIHFGNAIRLGDYVYCSSGQDGPAFLSCINVKTGKIAWRKRGFAKATCLYADSKIIWLDEDGKLALTKVSPDGLDVLSQCKISDTRCWSAPTLVGTTLYVRDREHIMALDLG
ncbi:MAG: PQQ-binding-like beta-propeller repeat protein [Phycisphaerae bacterium]